MEIIDLKAKMYRKIKYPFCNSGKVDVNVEFEDEEGEIEWEYICKSCDELFILDYDYKHYEEGSCDEEEWKELDEERKYLIGEEIE